MTLHKNQKLAIKQLRPGMFVGNVYNERGMLLYSFNTLIRNFAQIEALRRQGVTQVAVNTGKDDTGESDQPQIVRQVEPVEIYPETQRSNFTFEQEKVKRVVAMRDKVLTAVQNTMNSAKTGRLFSITSIARDAESIVEAMLDEPDIFLSLCQIKSHYTPSYVHSVNVAVLMVGFATALGYAEEQLLEIGIGGMLHDIGMVRLPQGLMHKQGVHTRQEAEQIKRHPKLGLEILNQNGKPISSIVRKIVAQHHERINGGGYPAFLNGNKIDEVALICAIADTYDSLTTQGMYQKMYLPQEALALIFQGADDEFPRELVEYFTKLLGIYPVGSFVKLATGEMGVVVKNNRSKLLAPVVKIVFDETGKQLVTPYLKDLAAADEQTEERLLRVERSLDPRMYHVTISRDIL
jgi:putative nucleotidyltransferase with HDIG domain